MSLYEEPRELTIEERFTALMNEYTLLMAKYRMIRADYEARLKTDLVAILTEIQTEIEELYSYADFDEDTKTCYNMVRLEEVQWVIDKYKSESEEEDG